MRRAPSADWPTLLTPEPGCLPPSVPLLQTERVLHVALFPSADVVNALPAAFAKIGTAYEQIDWVACKSTPGLLTRRLLEAGERLRPTLCWLQMQDASELTAETIARFRALCPPELVMLQWDGDLHWEPSSEHRRWFVELGRCLDGSLTAETQYARDYAAQGVVRPGYLQAGADLRVFSPRTPYAMCPPIIFLASKNTGLAGYATRYATVEAMERTYGERFAVYGHGWGWRPCARPLIPVMQEAAYYTGALAALSISIRNDVARYTSDRLIRMLCSGALCLIERFPDCAGLGLVHGENCYLWRDWNELQAQVDLILARPDDHRWRQMRAAAAELGATCHTWECRMGELMAMVEAIREQCKARSA